MSPLGSSSRTAGKPWAKRQGARASSDTRYLRLQDRIGYAFRDASLLERALTHPSSTAEKGRDNERLEFLGDGVLNLCIGQYLYEHYPRWTEGQLTQARSALVKTPTLARAAESLGLRELGRLGKGLPPDEPLPRSVNANLFEAVCGAVYLDGGMAAAHTFILRALDAEIRGFTRNGHEPNYKSALQQLAQRALGQTPHYRVVRDSGPDHVKVFETVALVGLRAFPPGVGRSKKQAEQDAARRALDMLTQQGSVGRTQSAAMGAPGGIQ